VGVLLIILLIVFGSFQHLWVFSSFVYGSFTVGKDVFILHVVLVIVNYFVFLQLKLLLTIHLDLHFLDVIEILRLLLLRNCVLESRHGLALILAHKLRIRNGSMAST
jgi:hypothetical protein